MSPKRARPGAPSFIVLLAAVAALLLAAPALAAEAPSGSGVTPVFVGGNPTCVELLAPDTALAEKKFDPPNSGSATVTAGLLSATVTWTKTSTALGQVASFTVTGDLVVSAVYVKASDGGNLYDYRPGGSTGDTNLHGPVAPNGRTYHDISHISFCFQEPKKDPPPPEPPDPKLKVVKQTTSGTQAITSSGPFDFSVTGGGLTETPSLDTDPLTVAPAQVSYTPTGPSTVVVAETALPSGWTLANLLCIGATVEYGTLTNGQFTAGTGGWDPGENAAQLTLAKGDDATCTFTNDKAPPPPDNPPPNNPPQDNPPPPTVTSTPPPVVTVAPVVATAPSAVQPAAPRARRVVRGTARLRAPDGCRSARFTVRLSGRQIRRVTITLDGRTVRTFTRSQSRYSVRIDPRGLRNGVHRIAVRVVFAPASRTRARTLRSVFHRCQRQVAPQFTG